MTPYNARRRRVGGAETAVSPRATTASLHLTAGRLTGRPHHLKDNRAIAGAGVCQIEFRELVLQRHVLREPILLRTGDTKLFSRFPRLGALTAATALGLVSVLPQSAAAQTLAPLQHPRLAASMLVLLPLAQGTPNVIGDCLDNASVNSSNGNIEQHTTGGLLYWRKSDSATIFTDGNMTWLNGPFGLQSRPNTAAPFDWENLGGIGTTTITPPVNPVPASAPPPAQSDSSTRPVVASGADWSHSDRSGQDLHNSNLYDGKFVETNFSGANLSGANLSNSDSTSAVLAQADLHDSTLYNAKFVKTDFSGANLSGAYMSLADIKQAVFTQADLTRVQLTGATSGPDTQGPIFFQAHLNNAKLNNAKLPYADFRQADLRNADLSRSSLSGADLRNADLRGADLSQVDFSNANLSGANLTGTTFVGAKWTNSIKLGCTGCP